MRAFLRKIEQILIQAYGQQQLSKLDCGQLVLYIHKLKKKAKNSLSQRQYALFTLDLDTLLNIDFNPEQKLKVVESMYRSYAFLQSPATLF